MSLDADCGYMVWDGISRGTLSNIVGLLSQDKLAVVYLSPVGKTARLQTQEDLERVIAACPSGARAVCEALMRQPAQMSLFG